MYRPLALLSSSSVALALAIVQAACGGASEGPAGPPAPTTGVITLELRARGNGRDADGIDVSIGAKVVRVQSSETARFDALVPGQYVVRVSDVAQHCLASSDSVTATVRAGATESLAVDVSCIGGLAYRGASRTSSLLQILYLGEDGRTVALTTGSGTKLIHGWSPDGTRLLFTNDASGSSHVFTVKIDGTDLKQLTSGAGYEARPRWSRDGARVAFWQVDSITGRDGIWIGVVEADGTNQRALVDRTAIEFDPAWAPDGSQLYFRCNRFNGAGDLCAAKPDGSALRRIQFAAVAGLSTPCVGCFGGLQNFETSPDGRWISFHASMPFGGPLDSWIGALDGSAAYQVAPGHVVSNPRWSPTGDRLLVDVTDGAGGYTLAVVNRDATGYRQLGSFSDKSGSGSWSPDGALIAFDSFRAGSSDIWVMNADGTGARRLTSEAYAIGAVWNPKAASAKP